MSLVAYLQANQAILYLAAVLLGLAIGSFLNVVIYRLPIIMEREWRNQCAEPLENNTGPDEPQERFNLMVPRSRCPQCGHWITALENIPVISYLVLRGKCSACAKKIPIRYPLVEIITALLTVAVIWRFGLSWQGGGALFLTWALIALAIIDLDTFLLPDNITLPFLWLGLILGLFGIFIPLKSAVIGAIAGYGILWMVYQLFKLVTGKEGMGFGDFKLLAMLGAWLGWQMLPLIILLSSVVGAVIGIGMVVMRGHDRSIPIPFGPYLAIAGWIALIWGDVIIHAYLSM
ncbi:MAG: prepilin peptidase [Gammaproteobacteria bacterium]|nr:prepilin peptidase [Gammaproteobacteria bacterium]